MGGVTKKKKLCDPRFDSALTIFVCTLRHKERTAVLSFKQQSTIHEVPQGVTVKHSEVIPGNSRRRRRVRIAIGILRGCCDLLIGLVKLKDPEMLDG